MTLHSSSRTGEWAIDWELPTIADGERENVAAPGKRAVWRFVEARVSEVFSSRLVGVRRQIPAARVVDEIDDSKEMDALAKSQRAQSICRDAIQAQAETHEMEIAIRRIDGDPNRAREMGDEYRRTLQMLLSNPERRATLFDEAHSRIADNVFQVSQADKKGNFSFHNVEPGRYTLFSLHERVKAGSDPDAVWMSTVKFAGNRIRRDLKQAQRTQIPYRDFLARELIETKASSRKKGKRGERSVPGRIAPSEKRQSSNLVDDSPLPLQEEKLPVDSVGAEDIVTGHPAHGSEAAHRTEKRDPVGGPIFQCMADQRSCVVGLSFEYVRESTVADSKRSRKSRVSSRLL